MKKFRIVPPGKGTVIIRLWGYVFEHRLWLLLAFSLALVSNLAGLVWPLMSGYAIEAIEPGVGKVDFDTVFSYIGLMLLFCAISAILSYILSLVMVRISQKVAFRLRKEVFEKMSELPVGYFDRFQAGDLISHITYDIDTINATVTNDLIQIFTALITVTGSLIMMILISPVMVVIVFFTIPISVFFIRFMTTRIKPLFRKRSARLGEMNGFAEEMISGQKSIKAYHQEETVIHRFDRKNEQAAKAYYKAEYYGSMVGPSMNFINNTSLSIISMVGAILYFLGSLTLGNLSTFILYSRRFSGPINEIANVISELQSSVAAAERVFRLIDEKSEPPDAPEAVELTDVRGEVRIEDVKFSYIRNKPVITGLDLYATPGKLVAIVGKTGSGKTTLVNLLMRFYDPDSGRILLDGQDITRITRKSLRLSYSMVLQDTWLFQGSVYDNVAYGRQNATREEVERVCRAAKIHHFIQSLPLGYDTIISDDGTNVSGGQKQLLTIARAMMQDSRMLILDEATSNVDTVTEQQIQSAMRELMKDKTCFVIAHRLSTIRNADIILVVSDGRIVEQGDHKTLLSKNGTYAQLYYSQEL
jgi:ATP-binding cassette, subfamily B, multidrug efflux pump